MELLSPAGDWDALVAAIENGADSVYLGLNALNARMGAKNFSPDELKRACDYCHERGKKVYVTVNTLIKQSELSSLESVAMALANAGADAAIVQDFGACEALSQMLPSLKLHASTQMAVNNVQGVRFLKEKGFERVVLARELTLSEIAECASEGIEIEVFGHGALCTACSGQCLFSSIVGGRSGNRGMCAQPCRLPYTLEGARSDGYLLSTKDLSTIDMVSALIKSGVSSLKIEGRLKRPEYVAIVTRIYRRAIDGLPVTDADREELLQIFNRGGFTRGYLNGVDDSDIVHTSRPSHCGVKVGAAVSEREILITRDVESADALVLRKSGAEDVPLKLNARAGQRVQNPVRVRGDIIRLVSAKQMSDAKQSVNGVRKAVSVSAEIDMHIGSVSRATVTDGQFAASADGWLVEQSRGNALSISRLKEQFAKTGGTPYDMTEINISVDEDAFAPVTGINKLRRDALQALSETRIHGLRGCSETLAPFEAYRLSKPETTGRLVCQARDAQSLLRAVEAGADEIALSPKDIRASALDSAADGLDRFFIALPPVAPSQSLQYLFDWANENAKRVAGVYISNIGQLAYDWPGEKRYDYHMNIASAPALKFLNAEASIYVPSLELTSGEISSFGGNRELVIYGRIPLMFLRHCPLNQARGGSKHALCHACDNCAVKIDDCALTDRMKAKFPLMSTKTPAGCVISVLNSVPLSLEGRFDKLPDASRHRLIFTNESCDEIYNITKRFRRLLNGESAFKTDDGAHTTGHYFRKVD